MQFVLLVPEFAIRVTESGSPTVLRSYTLTCDLGSLPTSLDLTNPSYQWLKNDVVVDGEAGNQLHFNSLSLDDDNTVYRCQYMASSIYLNNMLVLSSQQLQIDITSMYLNVCNKSLE